MHIVVTILLLFLVVFIISTLSAWFTISRSYYTAERVSSGKQYEMGGRTYIFPNIPIKGDAFILKDEFVISLRNLLSCTGNALDNLDVLWWLTGGSLLGAMRHDSLPMPYDDDIDVGVDFAHRELLFSETFQKEAHKHGLEVIYLFSNTLKNADRHGAAVRCQLLDTSTTYSPTMDIFFWKTDKNVVCKVDSWFTSNVKLNIVRSDNEKFNYDDVYPIQLNVDIDGLLVNIVHKPRRVLEQQYSKNVWDVAIARPRLFSHAFIFRFFNFIWLRRPSGSKK